MRGRDVQRSKLYAAEKAVRDTIPERKFDPSNLDAVQAYVDKLQRSAWFKRRWQHRPRIVVGHARGNACASAWGSRLILLPRDKQWAWCEIVILHEVAHCLTNWHPDGGAHGRDFARTFLELVRHQCGDEAWRMLRDSFRDHKVKWHRRREVSEEQKQAGAERLAQYRAANKA